MKLPPQFKATAFEQIKLPNGKAVRIPKTTPVFELWAGDKPGDDYGNKAILNFYGRPEFAELGISQIFKHDGWDGVWVDTYHGKYRTQYWPKVSVSLPPKHEQLLNHIYGVAKSEYGCWDVFCWKDRNYIFAESKRHNKDKIQDTQKTWLQAALRCGVTLESLLIVEWSLSGNQQTSQHAKSMNHQLSDFTIHTTRDSRELDRIYKSGGKGQFTEKRKWVEGLSLFEQAKRTGANLPIIFAAAETTTSSGLIYWAQTTDLNASENSTTVSFTDLQPITSHPPLNSLKLKSTGEPLSNDFIRSLAYVHTPSFLGKD
jgi:VRR-NUC domain.